MTTSSSSPRKRSYHHGSLKKALVEAGIDILEQQGLPALSLRANRRPGRREPHSPKNHFARCGGSCPPLRRKAFSAMPRSCGQAFPEASRPEDRLRAAMEGYVRFAREHKGCSP